jgi:hypothetical protein
LLKFSEEKDENVVQGIQKLENLNPPQRQVLFLGMCPQEYKPVRRSGIMQRMEGFINTGVDETVHSPLLMIEDGSWEAPSQGSWDIQSIRHRLWDAKVFVTNKIGSGSMLNAPQSVAVSLFTNNVEIPRDINTAILTRKELGKEKKLFVSHMWKALMELPPYLGEAFIGSSTADRKMYPVGRRFKWMHFASASTLWRVALDNTPSFTSKSRKGIVFIVKSKTGRYVAPYSQFSFDSEVMFLPGTTFKVTCWYHGDVICLGQENIREHTFGVKEVDDERMPLAALKDSDKSLIPTY